MNINLDYFNDKTILITGGSGSIGDSLVSQLLKTSCKAIRVLSNNEHELFISQKRHGDKRLRFLLGDVRDIRRITAATQGVDIVFHAAALKHLPLCEYNPFDAIQTNVIGTQNVIEAAIESEVERFVFISTDKAASPLSTLGATKLLAERLAISTMNVGRAKKPIMYCVRFGNVIGTRGSVFELFLEQIKSGKPITITSKDMTRFTMTSQEAINLILSTCERAKGGEIFVLKMKVMKIVDLAKAMIELFSDNPSKHVLIENGIREGEKIHEDLITLDEAYRARDMGKMFVIPWYNSIVYNDLPPLKSGYSSDKVEPMTFDEIKSLLREISAA